MASEHNPGRDVFVVGDVCIETPLTLVFSNEHSRKQPIVIVRVTSELEKLVSTPIDREYFHVMV